MAVINIYRPLCKFEELSKEEKDMFPPLKLDTYEYLRGANSFQDFQSFTKPLIHKESEIYPINLHVNQKLIPTKVKARGGRMIWSFSKTHSQRIVII